MSSPLLEKDFARLYHLALCRAESILIVYYSQTIPFVVLVLAVVAVVLVLEGVLAWNQESLF